jgi:hypothetical protein
VALKLAFLVPGLLVKEGKKVMVPGTLFPVSSTVFNPLIVNVQDITPQ